MTVLELPTNESRSTSVSLLPRNGIWIWSLSRARIHSLSAKRLLLISAPSILGKRDQVMTQTRKVRSNFTRREYDERKLKIRHRKSKPRVEKEKVFYF